MIVETSYNQGQMDHKDHLRLMDAASRAHAPADDAEEAASDVTVLLATALYLGSHIAPDALESCIHGAEALCERMIDRREDEKACA